MSLRLRLTLIVVALFVLVFWGLWLAERYRADLERRQLERLVVTTQSLVWDDLLDAQAGRIEAAILPLADALAAREGPVSAAPLAGRPRATPGDAHVLEVLSLADAAGRPVWSSTAMVDGRLPFAGIARAANGARGISHAPDRGFLLAVTVPVRRGDATAGFLTGLADIDGTLGAFAREVGADAFLVDLGNRLVEGTDPALWRQGAVDLQPFGAGVAEVAVGAERFFATSIPLYDPAGGLAGALVTLGEATEDLSLVARVERTAFVAFAVFLVAAAGLFFFYLRIAFRPVESAVAVLDALSAGDLDAEVVDGGAGEARRIAQAVTVFRDNARALADERARSVRRRRRQERLIRRQLAELAATLDPEGRRAVMADLDGVLDAAGVPGDRAAGEVGAGPDGQLLVLGRVLERLSGRITDQHRRLTALVAELEASIETKARLAAIEQQLEIARTLQRSFLPAPLPPDRRLELDALMVPALEVGGDFYDFFRYDDDRVAVVIADVSGKGVPAAFFMAITRTQLRAAAHDDAPPGAVLSRANEVLAAENEEMMFTTVFFGLLDLADGVFAYANAGHNRPFLIRAGGGPQPLASFGDPPVAVMPGTAYREGSVTLNAGDALFLYTDGVTEASDGAGGTFGEARLEGILAAHGRQRPLTDLTGAVFRSVQTFAGPAEQSDDITALALRFGDPGGASPTLRERADAGRPDGAGSRGPVSGAPRLRSRR